jgi:predicted N-formylglutamate amidohydrolase
MAQLLADSDPPPYRVERQDGASDFVLICDHAGRVLPRALGDLGMTAQELTTHVAWDIGIAQVGFALAARLDAFLILQTYSRLVIDANRPPGSPQSIVTLSERTRVPGNDAVSPADVQARQQEVFHPYHDRIRAELDRRAQTGRGAVLIALHSFTPRFMDVDREWHAGVLYNRDPRLARPLLGLLRAEPGLHVGDNQPYALNDATDYTMVTHGERRGLAHVEIEIRQDLIAEASGQEEWADRLARLLVEARARAGLEIPASSEAAAQPSR